MILVAIGANLPHPRYGAPRATCEAGLSLLARECEGGIAGRSRWFRTRPVPDLGQPWFVNGVVRIVTGLAPEALLSLFHDIEARFGRVREKPGDDRTLDLDLLDYDGRLSRPGERPELPHPRLHERAFVLVPLLDVAPRWRHPRLKLTAAQLLDRLVDRGGCEPMD